MIVEDDCGPGLNSCGDGRPGCPSLGEARRARSMLKPGRTQPLRTRSPQEALDAAIPVPSVERGRRGSDANSAPVPPWRPV